LAIAALALVVFGAYDSYEPRSHEVSQEKNCKKMTDSECRRSLVRGPSFLSFGAPLLRTSAKRIPFILRVFSLSEHTSLRWRLAELRRTGKPFISYFLRQFAHHFKLSPFKSPLSAGQTGDILHCLCCVNIAGTVNRRFVDSLQTI